MSIDCRFVLDNKCLYIIHPNSYCDMFSLDQAPSRQHADWFENSEVI